MLRKLLSRLVLVLALIAVMGVAVSSPAVASGDPLLPGQSYVYKQECGDYRPTSGSFSPVRMGNQYTITWNFRLSLNAKHALDCVASRFGQDYVELELQLTGFAGKTEWEGYSIIGSNIPGARHDVAFNDPASEAAPAVTGILATNLKADTNYYFTVRWTTSSDFYPVSGQAQRVSFQWVSGHWASALNPFEASSCLTHGGSVGWCVFPGGMTYISGAYYTFFSGRDGIPFGGGPVHYPFPRSAAGGGQTGGGGPGPGSGSPGGNPTSSGGTATYDGVIRIDGTNGQGVNLRAHPNDSAQPVGGLPEGTVVNPDCYVHGQNIGGTNLWWKVGNGYYSSFYDTVPLEWQGTIEQHYGVQNCSAIVDSDGDGTTDPNDACPHVYVAANNGCPAKGDFSLDGKSDVPSFYRYEGQAVNLWMWNGQSDLYTSGPYAPWGTETGWEGQRLIPAGTADYNGDKMYDTAAFYAYDGGAMGINVMYGNNQADLNPFGAWYVGPGSGWEQSRVMPAGAGDFNSDGRGDVAAFYRYDNQTSLYVWYGQENMQLSGPHSVWWAPDWEGARVIPVGAGDTDGDGNVDISTFYRHEGGMVDHNVWYGNGGGGFTLGRPWHVASGWDGSRLIPGGVTDLNGDGRAETIAFFRHDNNVVDMRSWWGTANRVMTGHPGSPWSGSGWDGSRIIPAGTGDYNGDGKNDMASFYRYDGQEVGLTIWYGTGTGYLNPFTGWHVNTAWEGARLIPPTKG